MEGLEISEILFSRAFSITGEMRWDSDYYQKHFLANEKLIHSFPTARFTQLCKSIKKGIFDLPPDNYIEEGIPFIRTSEIKNPTINFSSTVFISEKVSLENFKTELTPGDLVFTKIGAYIGDVALLPSHYGIYNFSQNVAGAAVIDKRDSAYLLAFFLSREGRLQILRSAMLSGQGKLELEDIRCYEIPQVCIELKSKLSDMLHKKQSLELKASGKYEEAEKLLLDTLGMTDFSPSAEAINVKSFKDSFAATGRLDAEYYQPKYEDYEHVVLNHSEGFTTIAAEFDLVKEASKRDKSAYNYIEIGDVNVGDGAASFNRLDVEELPANAKQEVQRGDLLISKVRPNRGAVAIIDFDDTDLIVSGAFTVLREKTDSVFSNETLKVLLRTKIYRDWMLKFNIGTQYPVIRDDDILNLPVPFVNEKTQEIIADLVKESFSLRAESARLLDVAKRAVEIAIEQDESAGMAYIEANS
ncbi:MAG: restriction endonuclease subunit S [Burkholderiales bacterium]